MAEANQKIIHTLHLYVASPSSNDDLKRLWQPEGVVQFGNSGSGYQQDAYLLSGEIKGFYRTPKGQCGNASASILAVSADSAAANTVRNLWDLHKEVIATYRKWEQVDRQWENLHTETVWGYFSDVNLENDGGFLGFEVHVMKRATMDDVNGTQTILIDCINEEQDEATIYRTPEHMAPTGSPVAGNWGELLDA